MSMLDAADRATLGQLVLVAAIVLAALFGGGIAVGLAVGLGVRLFGWASGLF